MTCWRHGRAVDRYFEGRLDATGETRMLPAIYLSYWQVKEGMRPGVGKMMGYEYTLYDNTFALNWDIVT